LSLDVILLNKIRALALQIPVINPPLIIL
jgi:hypothetical protein